MNEGDKLDFLNGKMDKVDKKLLNLLQEDSSISLRELAEKVELSSPSVKKRIKKLEDSGIIRGYSALLDPEKVGNDVTAFVEVLFNAPDEEDQFIENIQELPEVQECHHISGNFSILLKVRAKNTKSLKKLVLDEINLLGGVQQTRTVLVLATYKEDTKTKIYD